MFFEQRGFWSLCINNFFEVEMRSKSSARNANKSTGSLVYASFSSERSLYLRHM